MKLSRVRLRNFRCYKEEISLDIEPLTVLIGRNDIGKSTFLDALNIFFEDSTPDKDDANVDGDKKNVRIICEFDDLPSELILDADFPTDLKSEYLLNENNKLEIHKVYNCTLEKPKLSGVYAKALHPSIPKLNDLLLLKNDSLKARLNEIIVDPQGINTKINTEMRRALWASVGDLQFRPTEISLDAESARKIWEQLKLYLPTYSLFKSDRSSTDQDSEVQDPMNAAVKEAVKAMQKNLNEISQFIEDKTREIAEKTLNKVHELDPELASKLNPQFAKPQWHKLFKASLTDDNEIPINKRGSGVRRLILLSFFRAMAEDKASRKEILNVIYAIEEPETSQHPDNQLMLLKAFTELSEDPNYQVILSTHTPALVRNVPVETIRHISKAENQRKISNIDDDIIEAVSKDLGILPDHSVKLFIGLEGINDIEFLCNISEILHSEGEDIPNLRQLENDGKVIFIPFCGRNISLWVSRLKGLKIFEFHLCDRDTAPPDPPKYKKSLEEINSRDNCFATHTGKLEIENYIHPKAIRAARPEINVIFEPFDDVPSLVAKAIHDASENRTQNWDELEAKKRKDKESQAKRWLNTQAVSKMNGELLTEMDPDGEVRKWLDLIKEKINS